MFIAENIPATPPSWGRALGRFCRKHTRPCGAFFFFFFFRRLGYGWGYGCGFLSPLPPLLSPGLGVLLLGGGLWGWWGLGCHSGWVDH